MANNSFKDEYTVLVDELTHILESKEIVPELQNQNVVIQLLKSIKICEFLEDKLEISQAERKSYNFLKIISNYYAISNLHVDSYYYIDETTLNDDVHYLKVFSKNILGKDYQDLTPRTATNNFQNKNFTNSNDIHKGEFDRSNNSSNQDITNNNQIDDNYNYFNNQNPYNNGYGGSGWFNNFMNGFGPSSYGYNQQDYVSSAEDQIAATAASRRLNSEIASGKIYIYSTKPKTVPILKIVAGIACLLLVIVIIVQIALNQQLSSITIPPNTPLHNYINNIYGSKFTGQGVPIGSVMYNGLVSGWFFSIFLILIFTYMAYYQLKPTRTMNEKYQMHVGLMLFEAIIVLIAIIFNYSFLSIQRTMFESWPMWLSTFSNSSELPLIKTLYAFSILYIVLLCSLVLIAIVFYFVRPRINFEYLNGLFQKYFGEARQQITGYNH